MREPMLLLPMLSGLIYLVLGELRDALIRVEFPGATKQHGRLPRTVRNVTPQYARRFLRRRSFDDGMA